MAGKDTKVEVTFIQKSEQTQNSRNTKYRYVNRQPSIIDTQQWKIPIMIVCSLKEKSGEKGWTSITEGSSQSYW